MAGSLTACELSGVSNLHRFAMKPPEGDLRLALGFPSPYVNPALELTMQKHYRTYTGDTYGCANLRHIRQSVRVLTTKIPVGDCHVEYVSTF